MPCIPVQTNICSCKIFLTSPTNPMLTDTKSNNRPTFGLIKQKHSNHEPRLCSHTYLIVPLLPLAGQYRHQKRPVCSTKLMICKGEPQSILTLRFTSDQTTKSSGCSHKSDIKITKGEQTQQLASGKGNGGINGKPGYCLGWYAHISGGIC